MPKIKTKSKISRKPVKASVKASKAGKFVGAIKSARNLRAGAKPIKKVIRISKSMDLFELENLEYYFDLSNFAHKELFSGSKYVFDFLKFLPEYIKANLKPEILGTVMEGAFVGPNVFLGKGSVIQPGAWVHGPAIIGENCEIRHGAYVGANTLMGDHVVIGHTSEINNSVFLNHARAPHFAFVGHSILGNNVNLGAGTKLSNLKVMMDEIEVNGIKTGLKKIGAIIGDDASLGCNTVTQPATFIGKKVYGYPLALIRGFVPSKKIIKVRQTQEIAPLEE